MATYAFPLNGHTGLEGYGDVWSHKRRMAEQSLWESKFPNGAHPIGVKSPFKSPTNIHIHGHHQPSRSMPSNTMQDARQLNQRHFRNNSTLPSLEERGTIDKRHGKPVAPLNLKSSNYAFPASASTIEQRLRSDSGASGISGWAIDMSSKYQFVNRARRQMPSMVELVASILLPLPYICLSFVQDVRIQSNPEVSDENPRTASSAALIQLSLFSLFVISAATSLSLLGVGFYGKIRALLGLQEQIKPSLGHGRQKQEAGLFSSTNVRRSVERVLQVALPFLAATQIGGPRVGQIILVATIGELLNSYNISSSPRAPIGIWDRLRYTIASKKWTLAALLLQVLADSTNFTSSVGPLRAILGYLIIGFAVMVYPPPYSGAPIEKVSGPSTGGNPREKALMASRYRSASTTTITSRLPAKPPSLFSTPEDVTSTLFAGAASAGITFVLYLFSSDSFYPTSDTIWILVSGTLAGLSLILVDPRSMISPRKLGLALGLCLTLFVQQFIQASSFFSFAYQGVILGSIWLGCNSDTPVSSDFFKKGHSHNHDHHDHHDRKEPHVSHDHAGPHSRITEFLLQSSENWSLLHSILVEKDSRRIFYFMWCVLCSTRQ